MAAVTSLFPSLFESWQKPWRRNHEDEESPSEQNYWGPAPESEFYASQGVVNHKSFFPSSWGTLFTQSWLPAEDRDPRALVFLTHGYGSDTSWTFQKLAIFLAQSGYAVYAADVLGHGRSDGLPGYIQNVDDAAAASLEFYKSVAVRAENERLRRFLFGESMGGGMTFLMAMQEQDKGRGNFWDGAIFSAPLFVMVDTMSPSRVRLAAYSILGGLADTWAVMPVNPTVGNALKHPAKAQLVLLNPRRYRGVARVGTMRQLCRMCNTFRQRCGELHLPFLVLHGTADNITAPEGSQMLFERAQSCDKSIKLYDGFFHSLIQAELDENAAVVLCDIKAWLDRRTQQGRHD